MRQRISIAILAYVVDAFVFPNFGIYPVVAPGQLSLIANVPVTTTAEIGMEFVVSLKNWNQCNAYDNNLLDGNAFNPVGGDMVNGDNLPRVATARIVIVAAPQPDFVTRLGNAGGPIQTVFCIDEQIYFDNNTPPIGGASLQYQWQFFNNPTGIGVPLGTDTNTNPTFTYASAGQKLIRLSVVDANAAGSCTAVFDRVIDISPSLVAQMFQLCLSIANKRWAHFQTFRFDLMMCQWER